MFYCTHTSTNYAQLVISIHYCEMEHPSKETYLQACHVNHKSVGARPAQYTGFSIKTREQDQVDQAVLQLVSNFCGAQTCFPQAGEELFAIFVEMTIKSLLRQEESA